MTKTLKEKATRIVFTLQKHHHRAVFAGGSVRDMLLGLDPHDFDIATSAKPNDVEKIFSRTKAVGKAFGVVLVKHRGVDFEVATFRRDGEYLDGRRPSGVTFANMKEDASRRDFTVNAMFWDPIKKELFDFIGGQEDLKNKTLKFVGDPLERITEDNLRILRFIRFLLKLDFEADVNSLKVVADNAHLVKNVASERVREEFMKMLQCGRPTRMMNLLVSTGLMDYIIPEVNEMMGSTQDSRWHPEGDVYIHTLMVMENLKNEKPLLQLAGLFHDIGKPRTRADMDGVISNHGHDDIGAKMTEEIMLRLKFSNDEIELVKSLVQEHMKSHVAKKMKKSTLKRYMALPYIEELTVLNRADIGAGTKDFSNLDFIEQKKLEWKPEEIKPKKTSLVTGSDLIQLGYVPDPIFKDILNYAEELFLEDSDLDKEELLKTIRDTYPTGDFKCSEKKP